MPEESLTRHCHQCGWVWPLESTPGRNDACHQCNADMKVCLNCVSYDARVAHQCRDRRADPVAEKDQATFCEHFDFKKSIWAGKTSEDPKAQEARDNLKKLFGD